MLEMPRRHKCDPEESSDHEDHDCECHDHKKKHHKHHDHKKCKHSHKHEDEDDECEHEHEHNHECHDHKCESSSEDCDHHDHNCCHQIKQLYTVKNLVSNVPGLAPNVDPNALNSWGIVFHNDKLVVAQNHAGVITTYDTNGILLAPVITVPAASGVTGDIGSPTGIVRNCGTGFVITGIISAPATYLVATEDGTVAAYNANVNLTNAITAVNRSGVDANYKGLAITETNLYVADFHNNRIDTFDTSFNLLAGFPFVDPALPVGYAPFNIVYLHKKLYVLYAKQDAAAEDDVAGPGNGYVSIFTTSGLFIKRFISQGYLNSPWALIPAPKSTRCDLSKCAVLIGNHGDGTINAFDKNGKFVGRLRDCNCADIIIDGLWGLTKNLFFAAGPNNEENGLVGKISKGCCKC